MNAIEFDDWMLPDIRDDGTCDLCDERALPYNDSTEYGYCVEHSMDIWTGVSSGDFDVDIDHEQIMQHYRVIQAQMKNGHQCTRYDCKESPVPRITNRWDVYDSISKSLCTPHAASHYFPSEIYPHSRQCWLEDVILGDDFDI